MGNDPKRSVINADHQVHEVANLFIVDGSSFTTGYGKSHFHNYGTGTSAADKIWKNEVTGYKVYRSIISINDNNQQYL